MNAKRTSKLKLIPVELADMMIKAYDQQRRLPASKELSRTLGKEVEDTRSVWISKEALMELLEINQADGIRLYFAIADDYPGYKLQRTESRKKHTIVMVATKSTDSGNPTMENSIDCVDIPGKASTGNERNFKSAPAAASLARMPADDFPICPPPPQANGAAFPL